MSEPVVELKGASKTYRVYRHPLYQALGLFRPQWCPRGSYTENPALSGVDLAIPRGAKIGVIGRNGAGKSTLLKLVAGRLRPSAGAVTVRGRAAGLLELGTGFYPEFTGRENVFSALAHLGVAGRDAEARFGEIVGFAELEHVIDQPVRTYSTGMYMRLAFSVASCVTPDLLLVDEVLSVGDASFAHKCLERMRALSADARTTILFVSHNAYALTFLCDSFLWLDGGRVRRSGRNLEILTEYELAMREDEERRLAAKGAAPGSGGPGRGGARILEVWFEGADRRPTRIFRRGRPLAACIRYALDPGAGFDPVFDLGITRHDGLTVACLIFRMPGGAAEGVVRVTLDELLLNQGAYFLSVLLYRKLDPRGLDTKFYTIDENLCDAHVRRHEFKVEGSLGIETTVFGHPFRVDGGGEVLNPVLSGRLT